jgi:predicted acylesterase/phospholipase RssA
VKQGLVGVQQRVFGMMTSRRRAEKLAEWSRVPVTLVRPKVDGYGVFDFDHVAYFIEEGYRATLEALASMAI